MSRRKILVASFVAVALAALILLGSPWIYAWGAGRFWDRAEPEIHLIPTGYTGPVVILLNDSSAPREREGNARLFHIGANGVAYSGFRDNVGWGRPDYYYVDSRGQRTRIVAGTPCNDAIAEDSVQACLLGHTTFSDLPDRSYEAYVVGRRADQQAWKGRAESFVDSVVYGRRPY
jgi:hypothetical protein